MNEKLSVFYDPVVMTHDTGSGFFETAESPFLPVAEVHPENNLRLQNMLGMLKNGPLSDHITWRGGKSAGIEQLKRFHDAEYLEQLASVPLNEARWFTGTTRFGPGSFAAICGAAGLAIAAARHVWEGEGKVAHALCRPPGHHAQPSMADGYCFVNNIGVAIEELRDAGLKRAAVIDWDVHHGNGTQEGYYRDGEILTVSIHMDHGPWGKTHTQTGGLEEIGEGPGSGMNVNIPLPYGSGDIAYQRVFDEIVVPRVSDFQPEMLFIANGQDANQFDPNGRQLLSMKGFYQLGLKTRALADRTCNGRIVSVQEGGYAISYAAYCLHATLAGMLGRSLSLDDPIAFMPEHTDQLEEVVARTRNHHLAWCC